ncbi:hypothetical protein BK120_14925 [Paenibacillus sp. FSL A5-0031]|uniref:Shedu anti-phage system protein SduA domain-containing protein n=1 Tax=Paenibacillus sp. FSL A5-0031 TaxID=1920420 RepID=UPI00096E9A7B|nr:Shedu anti-phage system protein SduA domain-containing protein [Paenibacillus sp. FSL A5-0031]OME83092.1 hypothetical protein BK120_14925 [Paenibacillus sp. FSL A5-0031]
MSIELAKSILSELNKDYGEMLFSLLDEIKLRNLPAFLLNPDEVHFYLGKEHIALEYVGPYNRPIINPWETRIRYTDLSDEDDFLEGVVGFPTGRNTFSLPLHPVNDNTYFASPNATEILAKNNWNFTAQDMIFMLNSPKLEPTSQHSRLRNCYFYSVVNDQLKVRNIKWMEIFSLNRIDIDEENEKIEVALFNDPISTAIQDAHYVIPERLSFQHNKLSIMNRFIELYNSNEVSEVQITQFLAEPEHHFILKMAFFGVGVFDEKECEWADADRAAIRPDFFVTQANGFSDIVEFKLPKLKTEEATVGRENRETFSAEINSYISQTRTYREYFEDPRNRRNVEGKFGINVYYPKRHLVIGRRHMFSSEVWRAIEAEHPSLSILTYDDIVDTVMGHLQV